MSNKPIYTIVDDTMSSSTGAKKKLNAKAIARPLKKRTKKMTIMETIPEEEEYMPEVAQEEQEQPEEDMVEIDPYQERLQEEKQMKKIKKRRRVEQQDEGWNWLVTTMAGAVISVGIGYYLMKPRPELLSESAGTTSSTKYMDLVPTAADAQSTTEQEQEEEKITSKRGIF